MLEHLALEHFRSHTHFSLDFAPVTALVGQNGAGKTNILEAVSMLSLTTSWRTEQDSEVIAWDAPFCRITGDLQELVIQRLPYLKRLRVDGVSKRTLQVVGILPTVLFQPDDIQLLYGSPALRRAYMDRLLAQSIASYAREHAEISKVLKQRNRLLKLIGNGQASSSELLFWDKELDRLRTGIDSARQAFFLFLEEELPPLFAKLLPEAPLTSVIYLHSPSSQQGSFLEHLLTKRDREILAGTSLYGPHREDLQFLWDDRPITASMSRGQARALLMALKMVEIRYLETHNETKPILLLDDIFSEFDRERRNRLVGMIGEYQTILTTTELGEIQPLLPAESLVVRLPN